MRARIAGVTAVLAALGLVAWLVVAKQAATTPDSPATGKPAATSGTRGLATITAPHSKVSKARNVPVALPQRARPLFKPASGTFQISPSGRLGRPATVRLPLNSPSAPGTVVIIFTSESAGGPWQPIPTTVETVNGVSYAAATVNHLSLFTALSVSWRDFLNELKGWFNQFTSNAYANAEQPTCTNPSQARQDGYTGTASAYRTVLWCIGLANGRHVLKVVNNRRYPLLVSPSLPVIQGGTGGDLLQLATRLGRHGEVVIFPDEQVDFNADGIPPGYHSLIRGDIDTAAENLAALHAGIDALTAIVTRFGASSPKNVTKYFNLATDSANCLSAVKSGNADTMIGQCITSEWLKDAFGVFWGIVTDALMKVSEVANYFRSALNGIADAADGRSQFQLTVTRSQPTAGALSQNTTAIDPTGDATGLPNIPGADLTGFSWSTDGTTLQFTITYADFSPSTSDAAIFLSTPGSGGGSSCPGMPNAKFQIAIDAGRAYLFVTGFSCGGDGPLVPLTLTQNSDGWTVDIPQGDVLGGEDGGNQALVRVTSSTQLSATSKTLIEDYMPDESRQPFLITVS